MTVYFNKLTMGKDDSEPTLMTSFEDQKGMPHLVSIFDTHYFSKWTEIPRGLPYYKKVGFVINIMFTNTIDMDFFSKEFGLI